MSASLTTDATGGIVAQSRYLPYGQERWKWGAAQTDFTFTGQRADLYTHLIEMGARYYDPYLNRWISPDTIVPQASNSQSLNRYSYVHNNPVRYYDSDGHCLPFCIGTYLAMRSIPREYAGAGARFVANQGIPYVSDAAAFDAANMDNLWLAVNGDKVGLTVEQRATAYANGTVGAAFEGAAAYAGVTIGMEVIAGAKALPDLVRGLTQKGEAAETLSGKRWGPHTSVGPLGEEVANTFRGGSYTELALTEDTTLYRAYGGSAAPIRPYWSRTPPAGPVQAQMDQGLLPEWGNTATEVIEIKVPAGTTIYEGAAAPQSNGLTTLPGGGNQIFIPQVDPSWVIH